MLALYHNDMSACAQKVRIVLSEKGLEWESRHLSLRAGEHQKDWYLKLNPRAVRSHSDRRRHSHSRIERHQ